MAIPDRGIVFRSRWVVAVGLASVIVALPLAVDHSLSLLARDHVIRARKETYASDLELGPFEVALFPRIRITGEGLVFRYRGRSDVPPLISVEKFSANTNWIAVLGKRRIKQLRLEGLRIHVPPRHREAGADGKSEDRKVSRFVIDEIVADGALLEILPKKAGKEPLEFDIQRLTPHGAGPNEPMSFRATLFNAKPPGEIQSSGKFGPWQAHEPGLAPVSGRYTFQNADLSVFRGIAGVCHQKEVIKVFSTTLTSKVTPTLPTLGFA